MNWHNDENTPFLTQIPPDGAGVLDGDGDRVTDRDTGDGLVDGVTDRDTGEGEAVLLRLIDLLGVLETGDGELDGVRDRDGGMDRVGDGDGGIK